MNLREDGFETRLGADRLLPILRLADASGAPAIVEALADGGLRLAEISLSTPAGREALRPCVEAGGGRLLVGAGTVRTAADAEFAVASNAAFLVAPAFGVEVDAAAREAEVPYLPGVMTPTDVEAALRSGRELLKLFPVSALGAGYLRDLQGPFPEARFVATGGVDAENAAAFLAAGAWAVAVGGALLGPDRTADSEAVRRRAANLRYLVQTEG